MHNALTAKLAHKVVYALRVAPIPAGLGQAMFATTVPVSINATG